MALEEYKRKRDFRKTPEPRGQVARRSKAPVFVVQKHAASRLHYDFRLEHGGVLWSWAVPKGPSLDPTQKRLAMHVEDHPVEYGGFEGIIPAGEYGAGTVVLWDRGTWEPDGDPAEGMRRGKLEFRLHGQKLRGAFRLVRMRTADGDDKAWLLVKRRDEEARPTAEHDVIAARPESVLSGRDLEEVSKSTRQWSSNRPARGAGARAGNGRAERASARSTKTRARKRTGAAAARAAGTQRTTKRAGRATRSNAERAIGAARTGKSSRARGPRAARGGAGLDPARVEGARVARVPAFVEPQLATLVRAAPEGDEWIHEPKLDGYRTLCRVRGGEVRWSTRNGLDWTHKFRALSPAAASLRSDDVLIDGEVVVLRPDGISDFQLLQNALREGARAALTYYAFDLLALDGYDLRRASLVERKRLLAALLGSGAGAIRYCDHVAGRGPEFHRSACEHGLEGIVSKRAREPYRAGRGHDWLKVKCSLRQELVVGGWTEPSGSRTDFGALLVGYHDESGRLRYAGRVGTGFSDATLKSVLRRLRETREPPFVDPPRGARARGVHWAEPRTVIEVQFTGWTGDGMLRHPSFRGLREDKRPGEVVRERAESAPSSSGNGARSRGRARTPGGGQPSAPARSRAADAGGDDAEVAGVRISNPGRVLYPELGVTKLALARYYEQVAEHVLPHVTGRPISVVRCPRGAVGPCFYQRHPGEGFPEDLVKHVRDRTTGGTYVWIDSLAGLVALVQMGVLEIHPWGSRADDLERPDRMFFDLDPDPTVAWAEVVAAARLVHDVLAELGLESFVKTSGGKGLHVVVPLARRHDWETVKSFSGAVARRIESAAPHRFLAKASKAARKGKIFIDWLRNARSATTVAAYSTRAKPGATVSMPVAWSELARVTGADRFTIESALQRIARRRADPWAGYFASRQTIAASAQRALGTS